MVTLARLDFDQEGLLTRQQEVIRVDLIESGGDELPVAVIDLEDAFTALNVPDYNLVRVSEAYGDHS